MLSLNDQFRLRLLFCLSLLVALSFAGCNDDDDDDDGPPTTPTPATINFGATYAIMEGETLPGGIPLPVLAGDSVYIRLSYSGCNNDHEFEFRTRVLSDRRAEIWLEKITEDQACDAFWTQDEVRRVPFSVLACDEIYLIGPSFYSFQLR